MSGPTVSETPQKKDSEHCMFIQGVQGQTPDSSPLTPGTFDDLNPDARILTPDPPPDP